jgi:Ring finger domain
MRSLSNTYFATTCQKPPRVPYAWNLLVRTPICLRCLKNALTSCSNNYLNEMLARFHDAAGSEDVTVSGLCTHMYHRECIMDWMKSGHDECPNCRRSMWDPEIYTMIETSIQAQQNSSLSANAEGFMIGAC